MTAQRMMNVFNRGSTSHLKLSKMNFGGMGAKMMKDLADEKRPSAS